MLMSITLLLQQHRGNNIIITTTIFLFAIFQQFSTPVLSSSCSAMSKTCVCSFQYLVEDLRVMVQHTNPRDLIKRLMTYQCQAFRELPVMLYAVENGQIVEFPPENEYSNNNHYQGYNSNHNPSLTRNQPNAQYNQNNNNNNNRQHPHVPHFGTNKLAAQSGYHHPPHYYKIRKRRQISESMETYNFESPDERLAKIVPKIPKDTASGHHIYSYLGRRIQLFCSPEITSRGSFPDNYRIEWIHSNGNPVSAAGVSANPLTGELLFYSTQITDIDIYNCSVLSPSSNNNHGHKAVYSNSYQLSIVTDSINWLSITAYYVTRECSVEEMNLIQKSLKTWISEYVCPICTIHDSSIVCDSADGDMNEYELKFALTAFNVEYIVENRVNPQICTEPCVKAVHLLLLKVFQESMTKLLAVPIRVNQNTLYARENFMHFELMTGCLAGFEFMYKICFPCSAGKFSLKGESDCVECTHGFYQPSLGASRCLPCDQGYDTIWTGTKHASQCLPASVVAAYHAAEKNRPVSLILAIVFCIIFLILIVLLILCCCFPNTKIGQTLRTFLCCTWLPCCGGKSSNSSTTIFTNNNLIKNKKKLSLNNNNNNSTKKSEIITTKKVLSQSTNQPTIIREKLNKSFSSPNTNKLNSPTKTNVKYSQLLELENTGMTTTTGTSDDDDNDEEEEEEEQEESDEQEEEGEEEDEEEQENTMGTKMNKKAPLYIPVPPPLLKDEISTRNTKKKKWETVTNTKVKSINMLAAGSRGEKKLDKSERKQIINNQNLKTMIKPLKTNKLEIQIPQPPPLYPSSRTWKPEKVTLYDRSHKVVEKPSFTSNVRVKETVAKINASTAKSMRPHQQPPNNSSRVNPIKSSFGEEIQKYSWKNMNDSNYQQQRNSSSSTSESESEGYEEPPHNSNSFNTNWNHHCRCQQEDDNRRIAPSSAGFYPTPPPPLNQKYFKK